MKAPALLKCRTNASFSNPALRVPEISSVDQVMAEERAASFSKRSIKSTAKLAGLKMVTSMMDLTTLEGKDTPGKVAYLRSEEHTSELQSRQYLVCRLLLEKKKEYIQCTY